MVFLKASAEQRHDGDGHEAAGQEVINAVRHHKGRKVHISFVACTELPGNNLVADQTHQAGKKVAQGEQQGCHTQSL